MVVSGRPANRSIGRRRRSETRQGAALTAFGVEVRRVEPALERRPQNGLLAVDHRKPGGVAAVPFIHDRLAEQSFIAKSEPLRRERALAHAIIERDGGRAVGVASYLAIDPENGTIEIGSINYSPRLQRRPAATEAMYLLMRRVFDELGYRRYEWKCDSLNAPSRAAAQRLGFRYEGLFRQAVVYKGRSRDSAWFSVIDSEWPILRAAFARWLDPSNFDADGRQRAGLASLRPPHGAV